MPIAIHRTDVTFVRSDLLPAESAAKLCSRDIAIVDGEFCSIAQFDQRHRGEHARLEHILVDLVGSRSEDVLYQALNARHDVILPLAFAGGRSLPATATKACRAGGGAVVAAAGRSPCSTRGGHKRAANREGLRAGSC